MMNGPESADEIADLGKVQLEALRAVAMVRETMARQREAMRSLLGDRYAEAVQPARTLIMAVMERDRLEIEEAYVHLAGQAHVGHYEVAARMLASAALDLLEGG